MRAADERLWLGPIPEKLRDRAVAALDAGDAVGFLITASNQDSLHLVFYNFAPLKERGMYERALLGAFIGTRTNNHGWPLADLQRMFGYADRKRLLASGDPLPGPGPFTIYRGVAGRGKARRLRGLSWAGSLACAQWFAWRFPDLFFDPAVYRVTVEKDSVLAYMNERGEDEYLVLLPKNVRPVRLRADELLTHSAVEQWKSSHAF